jgi:glucose-1-phosphate thymidylyltransferase
VGPGFCPAGPTGTLAATSPQLVMPDTTKAVILARGLGTRMRRAADGPAIDASQAAVADTGVKAMIPIGRPFLDYVLGALADAGVTQVCLVVGPEHDAIRRYYRENVRAERLEIAFATQVRPLGTADAVLAAEAFAADSHFLVINSDNYYPAEVLARLRRLGAPGLAGFEQGALVREGNIDAGRVRKYAVGEVDPDGRLAGLTEKPDEEAWRSAGARALISMNCWSFGPSIFEAARRIAPSPRGELEITDAVRYAMTRLGVRFTVVPIAAGVLDLSVRTDIPSVARRLEGTDVRL